MNKTYNPEDLESAYYHLVAEFSLPGNRIREFCQPETHDVSSELIQKINKNVIFTYHELVSQRNDSATKFGTWDDLETNLFFAEWFVSSVHSFMWPWFEVGSVKREPKEFEVWANAYLIDREVFFAGRVKLPFELFWECYDCWWDYMEVYDHILDVILSFQSPSVEITDSIYQHFDGYVDGANSIIEKLEQYGVKLVEPYVFDGTIDGESARLMELP